MVGKRGLALSAKLKKIAQRVPPEKREEFLTFVESGQANADFLEWIDSDPEGRDAVEKAYRATADFYERLANNLWVR